MPSYCPTCIAHNAAAWLHPVNARRCNACGGPVTGWPVTARFEPIAYFTAGGGGQLFTARDRSGQPGEWLIKLPKWSSTSLGAASSFIRREADLLEVAPGGRRCENLPQLGALELLPLLSNQSVPYVVIEHLHGSRLDAYMAQQLAQRPALSPRAHVRLAVQLVREICMALVFLDDKVGSQVQFAHRDLKPENIFVETRSPQPVVKLIDFGLAKAPSQTTVHGLGVSPYYAPPEQIDAFLSRAAGHMIGGHTNDGPWDVWALGVILFELCTGTHPLKHLPAAHLSDARDLRDAIVQGGAALWTLAGVQGAPPDVARLLARCVDIDPNARISNARAMLDAIDAIEWVTRVPIDSPTLARALGCAVPGDIVELGPGVHEGCVDVKPGITVRGVDRDQCVLSSHFHPIVTMVGGALSRLTIRWEPRPPSRRLLRVMSHPWAVQIASGAAPTSLSDCTIINGNRLPGAVDTQYVPPTFRRFAITAAIGMTSGVVTLTSVCCRGAHYGLWIEGGQLSAEQSTFEDNVVGVMLAHQDAAGTFEGCTLTNNETGIEVEGGRFVWR